MSRRDSVDLDVDGRTVRLCGVSKELTPEAAAAIADVIREAARQFAQQPQLCRAQNRDRVMSLPCLREPDHEPPHRTGNGREWT